MAQISGELLLISAQKPQAWHDPHNNGIYSSLDSSEGQLNFQRAFRPELGSFQQSVKARVPLEGLRGCWDDTTWALFVFWLCLFVLLQAAFRGKRLRVRLFLLWLL